MLRSWIAGEFSLLFCLRKDYEHEWILATNLTLPLVTFHSEQMSMCLMVASHPPFEGGRGGKYTGTSSYTVLQIQLSIWLVLYNHSLMI